MSKCEDMGIRKKNTFPMQEQNANQRRLPAMYRNKTPSGESFLQCARTKRQAAKVSCSVQEQNAKRRKLPAVCGKQMLLVYSWNDIENYWY